MALLIVDAPRQSLLIVFELNDAVSPRTYSTGPNPARCLVSTVFHYILRLILTLLMAAHVAHVLAWILIPLRIKILSYWSLLPTATHA